MKVWKYGEMNICLCRMWMWNVFTKMFWWNFEANNSIRNFVAILKLNLTS